MKEAISNFESSLNSDQTTSPVVIPPSDNQVGLTEIARILNRGKWIIIGTTLASIALTWIYTSHLPRIYTASSRINIDLSHTSALKIDDSAVADTASAQKLATQLGILRSQSTAWDVIKRLHLYADPDFMMQRPMEKNQDPDKIPNGVQASLINRFVGSLDVQFERGTDIADIQYRSTSPTLAARIANEVAGSYIDRNFQTRYNTTLKATTWLDGKLDGLRKNIVDADQKFADFQQKTGLLQTDETHNPILDKLLQLNTDLGVAESQRIIKEDLYRASATIDPDELMPASTFPALMSLRSQKAILDGQYASLTAKYDDAFPRVIQLKNQMTQLQDAINQEVAKARHEIEVQYQSALSNERSLSNAVEQQKQQIFAMNQNALQYTILQRQVASNRQLYEDMVRKLQEAGISAGINADAISVVDQALPPIVPSEPRRTVNLEVGFVIGLVLGLGITVLLDLLNSNVQTLEDVSSNLGLASLGMVPHWAPFKKEDKDEKKRGKRSRPTTTYRITDDPRSRFAEAFRTLRSNLLLSTAGVPPKLILVCSSWPGEGKSTTAINLATVLAQANKKVLLIDADLRRPSLHRYFGMASSAIGLSEMLSGATEYSENFVRPDPSVSTLQVLFSGRIPPSSSELLMSPRMTTLLNEWRLTYDFIVVDSAPILLISDAVFLASSVDAVVVIARAGSTPRKSLRALRDNLLRVRAKIAGVILNDVKSSSDAYYEYYGGKEGKHDYYYSSQDDNP